MKEKTKNTLQAIGISLILVGVALLGVVIAMLAIDGLTFIIGSELIASMIFLIVCCGLVFTVVYREVKGE